MESLQHHQQQLHENSPFTVENHSQIDEAMVREHVWKALQRGEVVPVQLSPYELGAVAEDQSHITLQSDETLTLQSDATLDWLFDKPEEVIEHSFEDRDALTSLLKSDPETQAEVLPEVQQVQMFNLNFVQDLTGMSSEEAAKVVTDPSLYVSTIMFGLAMSEEFSDRSHITKRQPMEDGVPGDSITFAAQFVEPSGKTGWIATIGRKMVERDGTRHSVPTYQVESTLRDHKNGISYVLDMVDGEEPRVLQKQWRRGQYQYVPFADGKVEQQYLQVILGDMDISFRNYNPQDDVNAYRAAANTTFVG